MSLLFLFSVFSLHYSVGSGATSGHGTAGLRTFIPIISSMDAHMTGWGLQGLRTAAWNVLKKEWPRHRKLRFTEAAVSFGHVSQQLRNLCNHSRWLS